MKSLLLIFILTVCNSILNARSWPIGTPDDLSSAFGPRNLGTENLMIPYRLITIMIFTEA